MPTSGEYSTSCIHEGDSLRRIRAVMNAAIKYVSTIRGTGLYLALKMDEDIHLFSIIVQYSTGVDVKIGPQKDMVNYD